MEDNADKDKGSGNRKDGEDEDDYKQKDNGNNDDVPGEVAADANDEGKELEEEDTIVVLPTATEDGDNISINEALRLQQANINQAREGQGQEATASTTASNRPDAFQMYSDTNTRMLSLLGLDPNNANPNEGEGEDWRQLTGFTGIGEERRRTNVNPDGSAERRTRLSYELHIGAFVNMMTQRGELDFDDNGEGTDENGGGGDRQPREQQEEEGGGGGEWRR